jgi:hypothetical protein
MLYFQEKWVLTGTPVQELMDAKPVEPGLEKAHRRNIHLGGPLYERDQRILPQDYEENNHPPFPPLDPK